MAKTKEIEKKVDAEEEYVINPEATTGTIDSSEWPLLLKNYHKRTLF